MKGRGARRGAPILSTPTLALPHQRGRDDVPDNYGLINNSPTFASLILLPVVGFPLRDQPIHGQVGLITRNPAVGKGGEESDPIISIHIPRKQPPCACLSADRGGELHSARASGLSSGAPFIDGICNATPRLLNQ